MTAYIDMLNQTKFPKVYFLKGEKKFFSPLDMTADFMQVNGGFECVGLDVFNVQFNFKFKC